MTKVGSIIKNYWDDTNYSIGIECPGQRLMKKVRIADMDHCSCGKDSTFHSFLTPITYEEQLWSILNKDTKF